MLWRSSLWTCTIGFGACGSSLYQVLWDSPLSSPDVRKHSACWPHHYHVHHRGTPPPTASPSTVLFSNPITRIVFMKYKQSKSPWLLCPSICPPVTTHGTQKQRNPSLLCQLPDPLSIHYSWALWLPGQRTSVLSQPSTKCSLNPATRYNTEPPLKFECPLSKKKKSLNRSLFQTGNLSPRPHTRLQTGQLAGSSWRPWRG